MVKSHDTAWSWEDYPFGYMAAEMAIAFVIMAAATVFADKALWPPFANWFVATTGYVANPSLALLSALPGFWFGAWIGHYLIFPIYRRRHPEWRIPTNPHRDN
jgi:hypothetical protein